MTNKETVERNIGLTFDFVHYLIDHPELVETLPDNFELEFIEKDFPVMEKKHGLPYGENIVRKYVTVKNTFELTNQK